MAQNYETDEEQTTMESTNQDSEVRDLLDSYIREIGKFRLLTRSEEHYLGRRIQQGSQLARKRLILSNLKLVVDVARQYDDQGLPLLDLIQEGNIGLMKAVEKFDHTRGYKFSTYATWWIKQTIRRAIVEKSPTVRVPSHTYDLIRKINRLKKEQRNKGNGTLTRAEIAKKLDIPEHTVKRAERASRRSVSLDQPLEDPEDGSLGDLIPAQNPSLPEVEALKSILEEELGDALAELTPRERTILELRYGLKDGNPRSLAEIGKIYDLSRERVRQIEQKALQSLKKSDTISQLAKYRMAITGNF